MITRSGNRGVLHQVSERGGLLYIGGVAPDDPALDMAGQTRQMLEKLDAVLTAHGSDRRHVLMMHVFITDMRLKPEMNRAWTEFFPSDYLPSRITLGIDAIEEKVLIEASTIAVRRGGTAQRAR
jgi:enamine deaminase RidA (YjgF/YER057c/UK114 family)